jgi:hypothetical protein
MILRVWSPLCLVQPHLLALRLQFRGFKSINNIIQVAGTKHIHTYVHYTPSNSGRHTVNKKEEIIDEAEET